MLIVMTVNAKELPVAPIGRVVVVVVIPMVNRKLTKPFAGKFTPAARTDPWKQFERFLPVFLFPLLSAAPGIGNHLAQFAFMGLWFLGRHTLTFELFSRNVFIQLLSPTDSIFRRVSIGLIKPLYRFVIMNYLQVDCVHPCTQKHLSTGQSPGCNAEHCQSQQC
jgi:hypothetical protein